MMNSKIERVEAEYLEYEFVPPLDMPETWAQSWERQIEAALEWQAALEMQRAEGDGVRRPVPTMRTLTRMNTLLEAVRERLLQIQSEAANVAIAEMGRRQLPSEAEGGSNDAFTPLHPDNAQRLDALARAAFDVAGMAQTEIARAVGLVTSGTKYADRRQRAALIDFPDRRQAA